jgi:hypothetical protein
MRTEFAATVPAVHRFSLRERKRAINAILESRFSVRAFQDVRRCNAGFWASPGNGAARSVYGQAMREKQRLAGATDAQLFAEIAAARA